MTSNATQVSTNVLTPLTTEEFKAALPDKVKKSVNQTLIDQINLTLSDPDLYETYRDNLLSYGSVMAEGRFKISQYLNAVKYVGYKIMGKTNIMSYSLTFPDKIQRYAANKVVDKDIASYVTAYNKSKLVNLLMEQTMVPFWILNQDVRQKALNVQAELMIVARSEKVRTEAANSVLTHLKQPDDKGIALDITPAASNTIDLLRKSTQALVDQQRKLLEANEVTAKEVAHSKIIEGEAEDVTDE